MESKNIITIVLVAVVVVGLLFAFVNFQGDGEVTEVVEENGPTQGTVALVFEEPDPKPGEVEETGEDTQ